MLNTILVPLDGSHWSEQALPLAERIAQVAGARLLLAHVHVPVINLATHMWNMGNVPLLDQPLDAETRTSEHTYLATLATTVTRETGLEVSSALLDGPISDALSECAATQHADLIVMTTHGRGALSRFWLGSTADELVRQCRVPTLLIRPHDGQHEYPASIARVLVPLDGSPLAAQMLEPAATLARLLDAELTLLQVIDPLHVAGYVMSDAAAIEREYTTSRCAEAQTYLDGLAAPLRAEGMHVTTRAVVGGHVAHDILRVARDQHIDLIALATHGRGGVRRMMIGSVADKLIRGADGPVLVYRPRAELAA